MKKIGILIILSITFIACNTTVNNYTDTEKACITGIIESDSEAGKIRNYACEKQSLSQTIKDYTAHLNAMDFSDCPDGFSMAFKNHIKAWENIIAITSNHDKLRGEMHHLFDEISKSTDSAIFNKEVKAIWDTWALVEKEME